MGLNSTSLHKHLPSALHDRAHRCKKFHWIDESLCYIISLSTFTPMAHFPVKLEVLKLASWTDACPGEYPSCCAPSRTDGPTGQAYVEGPSYGWQVWASNPFFIVEEFPHLETLKLNHAMPVMDCASIAGHPRHLSKPLPTPYMWHPMLLNSIPITDLWCIFQLLEMPYLETLSHLVASMLQEPHWPHIFNEHLDMEYDMLNVPRAPGLPQPLKAPHHITLPQPGT
ncbi:hypothetical protein V8D89_004213 [Ganoderma adspersum]